MSKKPLPAPVTPPVRRPPLKTDDVLRLLSGVDLLRADWHLNTGGVRYLPGYDECAAALGHTPWEPPAPKVLTCTVCHIEVAEEALIKGEFCSTECEDWAFDNPDKPPYAPKGGKAPDTMALMVQEPLSQPVEPMRAKPARIPMHRECRHGDHVWMVEPATKKWHCGDCKTPYDPVKHGDL